MRYLYCCCLERDRWEFSLSLIWRSFCSFFLLAYGISICGFAYFLSSHGKSQLSQRNGDTFLLSFLINQNASIENTPILFQFCSFFDWFRLVILWKKRKAKVLTRLFQFATIWKKNWNSNFLKNIKNVEKFEI